MNACTPDSTRNTPGVQHTPGPWSREVGKHGEVYVLGGGTDICSMGGNVNDGSNGRLIAAAPDLLAALRKYVAAGFGNSTDFAAQGIAYDAAIEAIAKATGAQS